MRFKPLELYTLEEKGRDELGNPIQKPVLFGLYRGKVTAWSTEEIALLDRDVTRNLRKILTDAPRNVLESTDRLFIDGTMFTIVEVKKDFTRWRVAYVKEYFK